MKMLIIVMGLLFSINVSAASFASLLPMPVAFLAFAEITQAEYEACNDKPYRTVSFKSGSNHLFSVSECDFQKNKGSYK